MLVAVNGLAGDDIRKERVAFDPGATGTIIVATITGYDAVDYLVGARAGQTMSVAMETDHLANSFNVIPPDAENEAVFVGSTDGNDFESVLDLDGDWKVRVYLMRSAARRGETASYRLEIGVTGDPDPAASREANDFGPREWDARGNLGCARRGQPMQTAACRFKVIRYAESATVFVIPPNGGDPRILYFEAGQWSTDTSAEVAVCRRADVWTLTVDDETYEILEAVITGG
jgi:hypothetical protein